jgi:uncharacterized protein YkwD/uncharacterized membrane protein required for colicin V production
MNLLDLIIVIVILSAALAGFLRGFILGVYELLLIGVGFLFAAATYRPIAGQLERFIDFQAAIMNILAFIVAIMLFQLIASFTTGNIVRWSRRAIGFVPGASIVDRIGGILPGLIHGLLLATLLVLPIGFFATPDRFQNQLAESRIAVALYRESSNVILRAVSDTGLDVGDFVAVTPRQTDGGYVLPFQVTSGLEVDQSAEEKMLALVNEERIAASLQPLIMDPELVQVARAHSEDMFRNGYFSHDSPTTGSPFDRINAAGISYVVAGENLALAPTLSVAHEGLMDSPGHRANILEPSFGRAGIGAIRSPGRGTMYTQLFRD